MRVLQSICVPEAMGIMGIVEAGYMPLNGVEAEPENQENWRPCLLEGVSVSSLR